MKKIFKTTILVLFLSYFFMSCTTDFDETQNPTSQQFIQSEDWNGDTINDDNDEEENNANGEENDDDDDDEG